MSGGEAEEEISGIVVSAGELFVKSVENEVD